MALTIAQLTGLFTTASLAAAGAAAVSIPIAIHLLTRLRRQPLPWGAMRFLFEAYRKQRRRLQLEQWLLLLVRCLVVAVLGLALAEPILGGWAQWFGVEPQGRLVYLVIDDSLSTRADDGSGDTRFERLRKLAMDTVTQLRPNDRLAIWRVARPSQMVLSPSLYDPAAAHQMIESLKPRYGRSQLSDVLSQLIDQLDEAGSPADQTFVVILSDFAGDALDSQQVRAEQLTDLNQLATLLLSNPATSSANVQVSSVEPRRQRIVLAEGAQQSIPVQLTLRRFADDTAGTLTGATVDVLTPDNDKPITSARIEHRWSVGQQTATMNLEVPLTDTQANGMLTLRAKAEPGSAYDSLTEDNTRWAVVEVRRRLSVGLISDRAPAVDENFTVRDWMRLALMPQPGALELTLLSPNEVSSESIRKFDACILVRPDLLNLEGMSAFAQYVTDGGMLWITPPVDTSSAVWTTDLFAKLQLPWRVDVEPRIVGGENDYGLALQISDTAPGPLQLLGADWPDLQRPVYVRRWLELSTGDVKEQLNDDAVWLRIANQYGSPLLAVHPVGDGTVLLFTAAPHPSWTNLPTKPLFVPLLHESLRSVLGSPSEARRLQNIVIGDLPTLGRAWRGGQFLVADSGLRIGLRATEPISPVSELQQPGVFKVEPSNVARQLAVNIESVAGNTITLDAPQIAGWLKGQGKWAWLDRGESTISLSQQAVKTNLGWQLLWALLALITLETFMARWFSHAKTGGRSWGATVVGWGRSIFRSHPA